MTSNCSPATSPASAQTGCSQVDTFEIVARIGLGGGDRGAGERADAAAARTGDRPGRTHGSPIMWIHRRGIPLLAPPANALAFDSTEPARR